MYLFQRFMLKTKRSRGLCHRHFARDGEHTLKWKEKHVQINQTVTMGAFSIFNTGWGTFENQYV